jgi:hypothetical protein
MIFILLIIVGLLAVIGQSAAYTRVSSMHGKKRASSSVTLAMMSDSNEGSKGGVPSRISPNDLESLFSSGAPSLKVSDSQEDDDENEYFYDDEDEEAVFPNELLDEELKKDATVASTFTEMSQRNDELKQKQEASIATEEPVVDATIEELIKLESLAQEQGGALVSEEIEELTDTMIASESTRPSIDSPEILEFDDEYDLSRSLDKKRESVVKASMTIKQTFARDSTVTRRITKYDPKEIYKVDPMKYGAYRRWNIADFDEDEAQRLGKASKGTTQVRRGGGRNPTSKKTKGPKDTSNEGNSFYKALKNLSSGPRGDGESTGTGTSDPKKGMQNVQLPKPPSRKIKRRVVTPSEIDSIFHEGEDDEDVCDDNESEEDEGYGDGDEEDEIEDSLVDGNVKLMTDQDKQKIVNEGKQQQRALQGAIMNMNDLVEDRTQSVSSEAMEDPRNKISIQDLASDETPKWLDDAQKKIKADKKAARKKKKLTNDWRFWVACIAGVGFVSALATIQPWKGQDGPGSISSNPPQVKMQPLGGNKNNKPNNDELIL